MINQKMNSLIHQYGSIEKYAEIAFENAIAKGFKNPENYMYMYSDDKSDYFKNIDTRNYIHFDSK
jgi:hypothetical protein